MEEQSSYIYRRIFVNQPLEYLTAGRMGIDLETIPNEQVDHHDEDFLIASSTGDIGLSIYDSLPSYMHVFDDELDG